MVDSLETEQTLERLRIFPGHPYFVNALITDIGREHVLTPLHNLLMERKSEKGQYVGGDIHFQYLFDGDSFRSKLDQEVARQDNEKVEKRTRRDAEEQATKEREMTLGQRIKKWIGW
jgi:hypothetical protein